MKINSRFSFPLLIFTASLSISCGKGFIFAAADESPLQESQNPNLPQEQSPAKPTEGPTKLITLTSDMNLRSLQAGILEAVSVLPKNSQIAVPVNVEPVNFQYRAEDGSLAFSSTGFYPQIQIVQSSLPESEILRLNNLSTGLYISATISGGLITGPTYSAIIPGSSGPGYLANYEVSGKPKLSFTEKIKKRFPSSLNKAIAMSSLPVAEQKKWSAIMKELQAVGDRTKASPRSLLIIDRDQAIQYSIDFEETGSVQPMGAWSIAVEGTATRHGFANVPCAEFMSEVLRQAYQRAGDSHYEDFNDSKGNTLNFYNGAAAVVNFSAFLEKAGWIPWDPQTYIPPTGAFLMHGPGVSPGHTYMSAGDHGRLIIDNGMPQGRDLRVSSQQTIELMYETGVFFLPPGFIPAKW